MGILTRRGRVVPLTLVVVAGLLAAGFAASKLFDFPSSGGSLSPYLVGFYDTSQGIDRTTTSARLYLVNPTPVPLVAYVAFFDDAEHPIACTKPTLTPNDLATVDVEDFVNAANNPSGLGVIKIVTFDGNHPGVRLQAGLKGWLRHHTIRTELVIPANQTVPVNETLRQPLVESNLQEVPREVLLHDATSHGGKDAEDSKGHNGPGHPTELELIVGICS